MAGIFTSVFGFEITIDLESSKKCSTNFFCVADWRFIGIVIE